MHTYRTQKIRCKAFSTEPMQEYLARVRVENDGSKILSIWDRCGGIFTTCHIISQRRRKEIINKIINKGVDNENT